MKPEDTYGEPPVAGRGSNDPIRDPEYIWLTAESRQVLDSMSDMFAAIDREYRFVFANRALASAVRAKHGDVVGRSHWDLWPEMRDSIVETSYAKAFETGVSIHFEYLHAPSEIWLEVDAFPVGNLLHIYFRDITARKREVEELAGRAREFRSLLDAIPHIAWVSEADHGKVIYINRRWREYTGESEKDVPTILEHIHPEDRKQVLERLRRTPSGHGASPYDLRLRGRDGSYRWFRVLPSPVCGEDGRIERWIGTSTDIHEQVLAEEARRLEAERFEQTFETAAVGIAHAAPDGRWLRVNGRLCEILGRSKEDLLALTFSDVTHPDDLIVSWEHSRKLLSGELASYSIEKRYVRPSGEAVWVNLTVSIVRSGDGETYFVAVVEDINSRKVAEDALRESEAALRSFYDCSPLLMGVVEVLGDDSDILHIYDSPQTEKLFGVEPGGTRGHTAKQMGVPENILSGWIQTYRRSQAEDRPVRFEYFHRSEEGGVWLSTTVSYLGLAAEGRARFCYVTEDITERRDLEQESERSRADLEALMGSLASQAELLELATDAIIVQEFDGTITFWNRSAEEMYGWSRDEVLGSDVHKLLKTKADITIPQILEELKSKGHWEGDLIHTRRDGGKLVISSRWAIRTRADGAAAEVLEIARDVTEERRAQEILELSEWRQGLLLRIFDATKDLSDPDEIVLESCRIAGQELRVSRCGYAQIELDRNGFTVPLDYCQGVPSVTGSYSLDLVSRQLRDLYEQGTTVVIEDTSTNPLTAAHYETTYEPASIHAMVTVPLVRNGRWVGSFAVHQDHRRKWKPEEIDFLTNLGQRVYDSMERARAEREVHRANEELEVRVQERTADLVAANERMETFTYHVSHDLRAPLRAIISSARIIEEDFGTHLPKEARHILQRQARAALSLGVLIDDLLKLSRLSRQDIQRTPVDVTELARICVEEVLAQYAGCKVKIEVEEGLAACADRRLLKLALQNLLDNAVKYSPSGGVVRVGCEKGIGFYVADQGIGIDERYRTKIFEPFQRLHRDDEFSGTGIGLANVRQVMLRHGGKVWVESNPGGGSVFWFTLPDT